LIIMAQKPMQISQKAPQSEQIPIRHEIRTEKGILHEVMAQKESSYDKSDSKQKDSLSYYPKVQR